MPGLPSYTESDKLTSPSKLEQENNAKEGKNKASYLSKYIKDFADYEVAKDRIKALKDAWGRISDETRENRKKRFFSVDQESEKALGNLNPDELYTPIRLCHTNIQREQAKYVAYLTQSPRTAVFTCNEDASVDCTPLNNDFTTKARYNEWEIPLLRWVDAGQTHGFCGIEVIFDDSKPGHFSIDYIPRDKLIFPLDTKNLQSAAFIARILEYTPEELAEFVLYNQWDETNVGKLIEDSCEKVKQGEKSQISVEKVFFKKQGKVYVGWSCVEKADGWLREPRPLFNGRIVATGNEAEPYAQITETNYPLEIFIYLLNEDSAYINSKGRVFLDEYLQEACTSLMSSFVTAHRRASELYFARKQDTGIPSEEAQTNIKLKPGAIFDASIEKFQLEYPEEGMLRAIQALIVENQAETSQIQAAVMNRKDSRKTAKEIDVTQSESQLLSNVQTVLLSISTRNVYTRCYLIYESRVKAGFITVPENVKQLILNNTFTLKPAGDQDIIEKQKKIQAMMSTWPVIQNTPAASVFLEDVLKLMFPDSADRYIEAIRAGDMKVKLLMAAHGIIQTLVTDPSTGQLTEQAAPFAQQLAMLEQQFKQILMPQNEQPNTNTNGPELQNSIGSAA